MREEKSKLGNRVDWRSKHAACSKTGGLPSWMGNSSFSKLTELKIGGFIQCEQNNLPGLSKLPALRNLKINDVGVKMVGRELCCGNIGNDAVGRSRGEAFPKLERLKKRTNPRLQDTKETALFKKE